MPIELEYFGPNYLGLRDESSDCLSMVLLGACTQARTATPTYSPGATWTRSTDEAEMVYVPDGEFLMGSTDADRKASADEKPVHIVYLDAFWIDRTEVTNAQYVQFLNALGRYRGTCGGHDCVETKVEDKDSHILHQEGRYVVESGFEDHPVVEVAWYGAQAYCEWAGVRLPTEAEWEKAARGVDGRLYLWGNDAPDCSKVQYADCSGMTVPVGSKPAGASPYGVLDMVGNVWEWVADWYDAAYYDCSPLGIPRGRIQVNARRSVVDRGATFRSSCVRPIAPGTARRMQGSTWGSAVERPYSPCQWNRTGPGNAPNGGLIVQ